MQVIIDPKEIEAKSFQIIEKYLKDVKFSDEEKAVVKRVIHTTADPNFRRTIAFHPWAIKAGINAIKDGADIITDVNMVRAGINKRTLGGFGGKAVCYIDNENVAFAAREMKLTKAVCAMRKAARKMNGAVIAIGNAPTALNEVCNLIECGRVKPALVVGVPVGFVGAAESKERLMTMGVPYITNRGRRGGSNVAAAIVNALLILAKNS